MTDANFDGGYLAAAVTVDEARIPIQCPNAIVKYEAKSTLVAAKMGEIPTAPPATPPTRLFSVIGIAMIGDTDELVHAASASCSLWVCVDLFVSCPSLCAR